MNDKKRIGFEVLENTEPDKIAEMGADSPIISTDSANRILKLTKEKYKNAKAGADTSDTSADNEGYTVSDHVEIYRRSAIKRIITAAASCAAAAVLIAGSALLLWKKPFGHPPAPVSDIVSELASGNNDTVSTAASTSVSTEMTPATMTTVTTYIAKDFNITSPVSQEYIDSARIRALDSFVHTDPYATDIKYRYIDMNHDNIPELLVFYQDAYYALTVYRYNGTEYICDKNEYGHDASVFCTRLPEISSDESCIRLFNKEAGGLTVYLTMNSDYSLDQELFSIGTDWEYYSENSVYKDVWYHNSQKVSEAEYNSYLSAYQSVSFTEINDFIFYAAESEGVKARREAEDQKRLEHEEYKKSHPHCDDFASVKIDPAYLEDRFEFDSSAVYSLNYTAVYCDGTTAEDTRTDEPDVYSSETDKMVFGCCIPYGENDYAPCHVTVRLRKNGEQEYKDLLEFEIDFKNRTWSIYNNISYQCLSVDFCCPSDYDDIN